MGAWSEADASVTLAMTGNPRFRLCLPPWPRSYLVRKIAGVELPKPLTIWLFSHTDAP